MASHLPLEVQFRVISLTDSHTAALCALVCRHWVYESRKVSLSREIRITCRWSKTAADEFHHVISHPACTIRSHLTQVKVRFNAPPLENVARMVEGLIEHAPCVHTLNLDLADVYFEWVDDDMTMYPVIRLPSHYLKNLTKLKTSHWVTDSESVLVLLTLLSNAPVLTHLVLNLDYPQHGEFLTATLPPPPSSLRIVETDLMDSIFWKIWVFNARGVVQYQARDMFSLTALLCQFNQEDTVGLHGRCLSTEFHRTRTGRFFSSARSASALTHLEVQFYVKEATLADLDLQHAVNLSSITIRVNLPCGVNLEMYRSWISRTLTTARKDIVVDYESRILCDHNTTHEDIHSFDEALEVYFELQLTTFRDVKVVITGSLEVSTRFKLCEARARHFGRHFRFEDVRKEL